jgi:hypothetical protein
MGAAYGQKMRVRKREKQFAVAAEQLCDVLPLKMGKFVYSQKSFIKGEILHRG